VKYAVDNKSFRFSHSSAESQNITLSRAVEKPLKRLTKQFLI
jgi:hypothetical protein